MSEPMTIEFLYDYMRRHNHAVLATVSTDNIPESAYVGIAVTSDLKIIFDTVTDSRKYQNLSANPNISFVIGWDDEKTVQYQGAAYVPDADDLDKALKVYFEVFPDGAERYRNWKNIVHFVVEPRWIRYSDFNKNDGMIEEIKF